MIFMLFGPQGCGKGTIGKLLSEHYKIPNISSGALLRALSPHHPRYEEITTLIDSGNLAPQDFVAELLRDRISQKDCENGYILDGWGRAAIDLEYFDPKPDIVVLINITKDTSIKRVTGRRMCDSNGQIYNIYTMPEELLKECSGNLLQREDDTMEALEERLEIYRKKTLPVIEQFRREGKVIEVDGEPMPDVIFRNLIAAIEMKLNEA